jgi:hypothetical protein
MLRRSLPAAAILVLMSLFPARAIETPEHTVVTKDGKFEVRDYPALTIVRTPMGEGDFMRLFKFISGGNEGGQKIAMTAPVLTKAGGEAAGMSFILPKDVAAGSVPKPTGEDVALETRPPVRVAVFTYSGGRNAKNEDWALGKLRGWMGERGLAAAGEPLFAYYDPPWIPPFLRRNEAMIPVAVGQP